MTAGSRVRIGIRTSSELVLQSIRQSREVIKSLPPTFPFRNTFSVRGDTTSDMRPLTRRNALHGVAGLFTLLAGCSATNHGSSESGDPESGGKVATDPETFSLRVSGRRTAIWYAETETASSTDEGPPRLETRFVTDADRAESMSFAPEVGDEAEAAREFLTSTDYDAETVYIEQSRVGECFRLEFCHVRWTDTEIDTSYVRRYRDADVACETTANDTVVQFIRVPDTLNPESISGYGSQYSSGGCPPIEGRRVGNGTDATTEAER